jgi:hypothetical protein
MAIKDKLSEDLKQAMRDKNAELRMTIRLLLSEIHNQEIAVQKALDDDAVLGVLSKQAQQRRDSIEAFTKGNREDLVQKEQAQLDIILSYMPQQLSREEIAVLVREAIAASGAKGPQDMGRVMGQLMPKVRGKAEGREVSGIVQEMLKSLG